MSFDTTPSGLAVPPHMTAAAKPYSGVVSQPKGASNEAPSIPEGFKTDLKDYGKQMGRKYEPRWNRTNQTWVIWAEDPSTGGWVEAVLVYDKAVFLSDETPGKIVFAPLDRRVIEELYGSDLFVKYNTNDPVIATERETEAMKACDRIANERIHAQAEEDFKSIHRQANTDLKRVKHIMDYGHNAGYTPVHPVPRSLPTAKES